MLSVARQKAFVTACLHRWVASSALEHGSHMLVWWQFCKQSWKRWVTCCLPPEGAGSHVQ